MKTTPVHRADIQGCSQLVVQATLGVTDLVQAMHQTILRQPLPLGKVSTQAPTGLHGVVYRVLAGTSGIVYDAVRAITKLVGSGIDAALTPSQPEWVDLESSLRRDALISVLNGVLGDHMKAHDNPLTIPMSLRQGGQVLELAKASLAAAMAQPSGKVLLLLHGHCMNELQWCRHGHDHGEELAAANGFSPVYLRYNTGLHISDNGRALADLLEQLVREWPVPVQELCIVGYSMGGLVARSAFHYGTQAKQRWPALVHKLFFLGTPHHGSMLEQAGNLVDKALEISPYSHALSRLGKIRSAGTTDLRHGNLVQEDWSGRNRFAHFADQRGISQLPQGAKCYAIAAMISSKHRALHGQLVGDGLVPVKSALGQHRNAARALKIPPERQQVFYGMNHLQLLDSQAVYAQLQQWLAPSPAASGGTAPRSVQHDESSA